MKITTSSKNFRQQGFTLIEMIGVLAVIAILAAVLIPKVFEAINNARINNAAMSCQTAKTACADHYAKWGNLCSSNDVAFAAGSGMMLNYDRVLLSEGFLDKPFAVKISSATTNRVVISAALLATDAVAADNSSYNLDGVGIVNDATGTGVVEALIGQVTASDAKDLNDRIDGPALGVALGAADLVGRVKFDAAASGALTDVRVYLTHR